ncbi:MAG TPA: gliding motility lipoprotein GldD [Lentimicrobium sp.]|nr:gliding motility lipoprotein GldD [Lentimicrobium sp.]
MKYSRIVTNLLFITIFTLLIWGCGDNAVPKPRGYFRIDLPEKSYKTLDSIFPYKFDYPSYAVINRDLHAPDQPYWINVDFPRFRANLHLSYKPLDGNLSVFAEDAHSLVMKHIPKASAIDEIRIDNEKNNVHGIVYDIQGIGAASPYQFYITDSTRHFLRGALYFNTLPNNDSLAPVIEFLKEDIMHMLETTSWKK